MRDMKVLALWASAMLLVSSNCKQIPKIGPYTFSVRELSQCFDEGTRELDFRDLSIRKISRTIVELSMRVTSNITIDDSLEIHLNNAIWTNGGWKRNSLTYNHGPLCTVGETMYPEFFDDITAQLRTKYDPDHQVNKTGCPFPPPGYNFIYLPVSVFIRIPVNSERFLAASNLIPQLPYGRYKAEMMIVKDGETKGCVAGIVDIVPRRVKGRS